MAADEFLVMMLTMHGLAMTDDMLLYSGALLYGRTLYV